MRRPNLHPKPSRLTTQPKRGTGHNARCSCEQESGRRSTMLRIICNQMAHRSPSQQFPAQDSTRTSLPFRPTGKIELKPSAQQRLLRFFTLPHSQKKILPPWTHAWVEVSLNSTTTTKQSPHPPNTSIRSSQAQLPNAKVATPSNPIQPLLPTSFQTQGYNQPLAPHRAETQNHSKNHAKRPR